MALASCSMIEILISSEPVWNKLLSDVAPDTSKLSADDMLNSRIFCKKTSPSALIRRFGKNQKLIGKL